MFRYIGLLGIEESYAFYRLFIEIRFLEYFVNIFTEASLEWCTTDQLFFWQLVGAHELPTKHFLPLISLVDAEKHSEACSQLLLILQLEKYVNVL